MFYSEGGPGAGFKIQGDGITFATSVFFLSSFLSLLFSINITMTLLDPTIQTHPEEIPLVITLQQQLESLQAENQLVKS